ncbi:unnamed protein product [Amoebophrya sp. A120]|nr:unnamed protein product [Amoebophrya sp. A120]|eukprot:GSA120T00020715001.1
MGYSETSSSKLDMYSNGDGITFHTFISTMGLGFGNEFFLCFDPDGSGSDYVDGFARLSVYLGGLNPAYTDDNAGLFVIRTTADESFEFECLGCHSASPTGPTAYLRFGQFAGCDTTDFDGVKEPSGTTVSRSSLLTGSGNKYTMRVDATTMLVGGMYRICMDFDGYKTFMPFQVSHRRLVVSPVKYLRKKYVAAPNDRGLTLDMMPGYDLTIRGSGYLGERCDPSQSGFISAGLGQTNQCQIRYNTVLGYWECTVEAINLLTYMKIYKFCYDADGTGTVTQFQETGFEVVMGIGEEFGGFQLPVGGAISGSSVTALQNTKITIGCPQATCVGGTMMAYLSLDKGTAYEDRSCLAYVYQGGVNATGIYQTGEVTGVRNAANSGIEFTIDASALQGGARYRLCLDRDGAAGTTYGFAESGLILYMSPIQSMVTIAIYEKYNDQTVQFVCPTCKPGITLAYLAVASISGSAFLHDEPCDVNNVIGTTERKGNLNTESFPLTPVTVGSTTFEMKPIYTSILRAGQFYKICIDLDGTSPSLGVGYSGYNVYISTVWRVEPRAIAPVTRVLIQLYCDHCNPEADLTELHVARECDFTRIGGNQRLLGVDGFSSTSVLLVGNAGSSALENTRQFIDSRPLTPGENYNVCTDTDGEAFVRAMGDTGLRLYTNSILAVDKFVIKKTNNQTLTFTCSAADTPTCTENSTVYLGEFDCDRTDNGGVKQANPTANSASTNLTSIGSNMYTAIFDATDLRAGWYYRVCQDIDGPHGPAYFGDTGYDIYISPFKTLSNHGAIEKASNTHAVNILTVTCWDGSGCSANTRIHVDTSCNKDVLDGLNTPVAGTSGSDVNLVQNPLNAAEFFAALDAALLTVGNAYVLCIDLDGYTTVAPWGESGFPIYIRNLLTATNKRSEIRSVPKKQFQKLFFTGTSSSVISSETTVYLDLNGCDTSVGSGYNQITALGSTRSSSQQFSGDPSGTMETELDCSNLDTGFFYHLCLDQEGSGNPKNFGDSGFQFFVTPYISLHYTTAMLAIQPSYSTNSVYETAVAGLASNVASTFFDQTTKLSKLKINCPTCQDNVTMSYLTFAPSRSCPDYFETNSDPRVLSDNLLAGDPNLAGIITKTGLLQRDLNYTLHNYKYDVEFSTDKMLVGGHYWLCVDQDGIGDTHTVGHSSYKIYNSPIPTEHIGAVPTQDAQTITFTCFGCTTNTYAYLTRQRGDEPTGCHDTRTGTTRPRVDNTGNENNAPALITLVNADTYQWSLTFDARPFYQGELYILCMDLDGDLTTFYNGASYTLYYGDTGAKLFLSLVTALKTGSRRLLPQASQRVNYITPFGGQATEIRVYLVHLYGKCEYDLNTGVMTADGEFRTATAAWQNQAGQWYSMFDASPLRKGQVYRLCMDYDGINTEKYFADMFLQVYVLDIDILTPGIIQQANQVVQFRCADCLDQQTSVYLTSADDCDIFTNDGSHTASAPVTTNAVLLDQVGSASSTTFQATLDAALLTSGNRYKVCLDLDGRNGTLPFGYTELSTYITGATLAFDTSIPALPSQQFTVYCSVCTSATTLYLAAKSVGCDTTDFDAGQVSQGASSSGFAPFVLQSTTSTTKLWSVTVDASALTVGSYYTICTDLDGTATALASGDAQQFVYISPPNLKWRSDQINQTFIYNAESYSTPGVITVDPATGEMRSDSGESATFYQAIDDAQGKSNLFKRSDNWIKQYSNVILSDQNQELFIHCPTGCTENTTAYLGTNCQAGDPGKITTIGNTKLELVNEVAASIISKNIIDGSKSVSYGSNTLFKLTLDTSAVLTGGYWKLCLITGQEALESGFSQLYVHTTPAINMENRLRYFEQKLDQVITFECPTCIPGVTTAYLASQFPVFTACFQTESGLPLSTLLPSETNSLGAVVYNSTKEKYLSTSTGVANVQNHVEFQIDARRLTAGFYYHICVDKDGDSVTATTSDSVLLSTTSNSLVYGDTLLTVYLTPVLLATTTIFQQLASKFEVNCPACRPLEDRAEINVTRTRLTTVPIYVFYDVLENVTVTTVTDNGDNTTTTTYSIEEQMVTKNYTNGTDIEVSYYDEKFSGVLDLLQDSTGTNSYTTDPDGVNLAVSTSVYATTAYIGDQACEQRYTVPAEVNVLKPVGISAELLNRTEGAYAVNKSAVELADVRKMTGYFDFVFDTSHLIIGKTYSLCIDLDGKGGPMSYGYSGVELFVSPITGKLVVEERESFAPSIFSEANQTVRATCGGGLPDSNPNTEKGILCTPGVTKGYLVLQKVQLQPLCETLLSGFDSTNLVYPRYAGELSSVVEAKQAVSTVVTTNPDLSNKFDFTFDASTLTQGGMYRLCLDLGVPPAGVTSMQSKRSFGDTGLTVFVSGVTTLITTGLVIGLTMAYADLSLYCHPNQQTGQDSTTMTNACSTDSMAYLSTTCDESVTDSVPMNNITEATEVVPFRISYLDTQKIRERLLASSSSGETSSSSASNDTTTATISYANTTFDSSAVFSSQLSQTYNGTLFQLRLNTRKLVNGRHFSLCTDLDGFKGPKFMGSTGHLVYTAEIPFVDADKMLPKNQDWVAALSSSYPDFYNQQFPPDNILSSRKMVEVNITCLGCTNFTEAYLLNSFYTRCNVRDGGGNATQITGVQTESTEIRFSDFNNVLYQNAAPYENSSSRTFFPFLVDHLLEGYDYRLCVDLNTNNSANFFYGDLMYLLYMTPVISTDVSVLYQDKADLHFVCPNCTDANSVAFLAENCAQEGLTAEKMQISEGNLTAYNTGTSSSGSTQIQMNGAKKLSNSLSSINSFKLQQDLLTTSSSPGMSFELGKFYQLCIDMDGDTVFGSSPASATSGNSYANEIFAPTAATNELNIGTRTTQPMRFSGFNVFTQSIDLLQTTSVYKSDLQVVYFRCLPGTCSKFVTGFLADSFTDCSESKRVSNLLTMEPANFVGLNFYAFSGINATDLTVGREYGLCLRYPSSTATNAVNANSYGPSGWKIYVHPIQGTPVATLTYRSNTPIEVEIYLCSNGCEQVADETYAYLSAESCEDGYGLIANTATNTPNLQKLRKELVVVSNTYRYFVQVPFPDTQLQVGRNHLICTAVNTSAVADSFFSSAETRSGLSISAGFPSLNDTLIGNTHVSIYINFAYDFGSTIYYAYPLVESVSESVLFGPQEYSAVWEGQGWAFSSFNGTDGFSNLTLSSQNFSENLNLTNVLRTVDTNRTQRVTFSCDKCGLTADEIHALYVGLICQRSITDGIYPSTPKRNTDATLVYNDLTPALSRIQNYYADVAFGPLQAGGSYDVCVDYDRTSSLTTFDYTGTKFLVTGVTGSLNTSLYANLTQLITVVCNTCFSGVTRAFLALDCYPKIPGTSYPKDGRMRKWTGKRTAAASFEFFLYNGTDWNGTLFQFTVDASHLESGSTYNLCVDEDGPQLQTGFEDVRLRYLVL